VKLLTASAVSLRYGDTSILEGVSLDVIRGDCIGLIGPNGAGKTSLLRILAGLTLPTAGLISLTGIDESEAETYAGGGRVGYHAQSPEMHWPLPVKVIVALGRFPYAGSVDRLTPHDEQAVLNACRLMQIEHLLDRRSSTLSGGELARVHMARLLASEPKLILADEPVANLDPRHQTGILSALRRHAELSGATVVVLHDLALAARFCTRLVMMKNGRVLADGSPEAVLSSTLLEACFDVDESYRRYSGIQAVLTAADCHPASPPAEEDARS
jgi:iron complex transport system ATP-binding protein